MKHMKAELIRIGNSRGIRIPKPIIDQCGLGRVVELRVERNSLVVSPQRRLRQGWKEAFEAAGPSTHDELLLEESAPSEFDLNEWNW